MLLAADSSIPRDLILFYMRDMLPTLFALNDDQDLALKLALIPQVNKDKKGPVGRTVLHWAAANGLAELTSGLVKAGADTTIRDNNGQTALEIAQEHQNEVIVSILKV